MKQISPLAASVAWKLRDAIARGEYEEGRTLPSERDLATLYGVSRLAIRKALEVLSGDGLLEVKARCRPVVRRRVAVKRSTTTSLRHISIWLWPHASEYVSSLILKGIQRGLGRQSGLKLVVDSPSGSVWSNLVESERDYLSGLANEAGLSGAILWYLGGPENRDALSELLATAIPLVFVDRTPPQGVEGDHVGTANESAACRVVEHLIELGHSRIACFRNMDSASSVQERVRGWEMAMTEAGLDVEGLLLRPPFETMPTEREAIELALAAALETPQAPTAIFCINDSLALSVHEILTQWEISVPETMSIAGFDGLMRWVPGGGHITTAHQDFERVGELSARLLLSRIRTGPSATFRHILLDAPLSLQGSTARPRQHDLAGFTGPASLEIQS